MTYSGTKSLEFMIGESIHPQDILYFYDEPIVFTIELPYGKMLVLKVDSEQGIDVFIGSPITEDLLEGLRKGRLSLRSAFLVSWLWVLHVDDNSTIIDAWTGSANDVPDDYLPESNIGLYPAFGPVFDATIQRSREDTFLGVYFTGGELGNNIPFFDFKSIVDNTYSSFRRLFISALSKYTSGGTITETLAGRLLRMPIKEPKFASLSLELEMPSLDMYRSKKRMDLNVDFINSQFYERTNNFLGSIEEVHDEMGRASAQSAILGNIPVLDLIYNILPDESTPFDSVAFFGFSHKTPMILERSQGTLIKSVVEESERTTRNVIGTVVEVNIPSHSFLLDADFGKTTTCRVPEELWQESMNKLLDIQGTIQKIQVTGRIARRIRRNLAEVKSISFLNGN